MQAMVLAAGLGTRLRPLTDQRAKPAIPFLGVPVVRTIVEALLREGFSRVVVNLHHRPDTVREALRELPVAFSCEPDILGTAGGPALALDRGLLRVDEPLLLVNGKIHTDIGYRETLERHVTTGTSATMVLVENSSRAAFREVRVRDDRVIGFGPGRVPVGLDPLAFTGVQVLGPEVLRVLEPRPTDSVRDVLPGWIEAGRVGAHVSRTRWWELSTPERYLGLHLRARRSGMVERPPRVDIDPTARLEDCVVWDDAAVDADADLSHCVVLSGTRVPRGAKERFSVLHPSLFGAGLTRSPLERDEVLRASGP